MCSTCTTRGHRHAARGGRRCSGRNSVPPARREPDDPGARREGPRATAVALPADAREDGIRDMGEHEHRQNTLIERLRREAEVRDDELAEHCVRRLAARRARSPRICARSATRSRPPAAAPPPRPRDCRRRPPGARPSRISGDFYLVAEGPQDATVLVIGDVVGHGLQRRRGAPPSRGRRSPRPPHSPTIPAQPLELGQHRPGRARQGPAATSSPPPASPILPQRAGSCASGLRRPPARRSAHRLTATSSPAPGHAANAARRSATDPGCAEGTLRPVGGRRRQSCSTPTASPRRDTTERAVRPGPRESPPCSAGLEPTLAPSEADRRPARTRRRLRRQRHPHRRPLHARGPHRMIKSWP